ncbi:YbaB/EbfC family nucleoid-associated protein [Kribbella sp. NPDC051718]|uniref:YbaB/EbfC family nucleoid-associated protein n=1 Tax=Kribbella sp. NPDC051718 TaxID=3155168 RepID=UPI003426C5CA
MFDGGGSQGAGGFDMSNLLAQAQAMQSQLMEAQANLESQEVEGSAGGGLVTALVSGTGELLSLTINPQAVDPDDTETLADLVVAAVRDASENAKQLAANAMGPLAGGLGGGLPGLDGMFGGADSGEDEAPKPAIGFGNPSGNGGNGGNGGNSSGSAGNSDGNASGSTGQAGQNPG